MSASGSGSSYRAVREHHIGVLVIGIQLLQHSLRVSLPALPDSPALVPGTRDCLPHWGPAPSLVSSPCVLPHPLTRSDVLTLVGCPLPYYQGPIATIEGEFRFRPAKRTFFLLTAITLHGKVYPRTSSELTTAWPGDSGLGVPPVCLFPTGIGPRVSRHGGTAMSHRVPRDMRTAPRLDERQQVGPVRRRHALLINPFYPKDPHASFGKHVLTPSLALTSIAGATPPDWEVRYWDENLLAGAAAGGAVPAGRRDHRPPDLRRARLRAGRLVSRPRGEGHPRRAARAVVPRGGAPARRRAGDRRGRAGLAGDPPRRRGGHAPARLPRQLPAAPTATTRRRAATLLPRGSFLTTTSLIATRGCHNRCGFCYLATDGLHMPYQVRDVEQVVAEFRADGQPYGVFIDNNLGSRPEYLREPLPRPAAAGDDLERRRHDRRDRRPVAASARWRWPAARACSSASSRCTDENLADARKKTPGPADYARRVAILHDHGIQVNGSFVLGFDHDRTDVSRGRSTGSRRTAWSAPRSTS